MSVHDPACCLDDMPGTECPVCASVALARSEERERASMAWRLNLRPIEVRNYERGYQDAVNGRRPQP